MRGFIDLERVYSRELQLEASVFRFVRPQLLDTLLTL